MGVAIFSALQDQRVATTQIQSTLDGLAGSLELAVRDASRAGLQDAIRELKDEAYAIGPSRRGEGGVGGFRTGEAEKIISQVRRRLGCRARALTTAVQLVDQLSAQERIREEEESLALTSAGYPSLVPRPAVTPYRPSPAYEASSDLLLSSNGASGTSTSSELSRSRNLNSKGKRRASSVPTGSIVFSPLDPVTNEDLVDPVLANGASSYSKLGL